MKIKTAVCAIVCTYLPFLAVGQEKKPELEPDVLFCIGWPDGFCDELALAKTGGYTAYPRQFPSGKMEYVVGKSKPEADWPFVHPAPMDQYWAKGEPVHPFTIKFDAKPNSEPLTFVIGYLGTLDDRMSQTEVTVNGSKLPTQLPRPVGHGDVVFNPTRRGNPGSMRFTIPANVLRDGANEVTIRLLDKSWILYDYVALRKENKPLANRDRPEANLLTLFRDGPMSDVQKIVFAVRPFGRDGHWYANFGYYADDENRLPFPNKGGKLCILDLDTKEVQTLLDDPEGAVRDPMVHYDAKKILFSYRPGNSKFYHLYEINIDGNGLRQITNDDFDDIEPTYLPNGDIVFVSSRAQRWVQCWLTPVATMHRCDANGDNIKAISCNVEHDNTPWVLPNGQVIYTRWEYVDRSQVHYHHLWIANPDGIRQTVLYGNMHPGTTMIDAKSIPGSDKIVVSFSPGHGQREHAGVVTVVDLRLGPDDQSAAKAISRHANHRDPWAFSETAFLAADDARMMLIDEFGNEQTIYQLADSEQQLGLKLHEPRPIIKRERERIIPEQVDWAKATGELTLLNVYDGRNMAGVPHGSIKKLLVLETLPKPINFTGGMEPLTYGGSFTLERIVGTIPVEEDGSAFMELPALRSLLFVALDENDMSIKRMQSFLNVMPGESTTCIGCHENRTATPIAAPTTALATRRPPSKPISYAGIPDVIDYPRDVQPVWDRNCVSCHNPDKREGHFNLSGHRGPMYSISYSNIMTGTHSALENEHYGQETLVADGRNRPLGNYPPRTLGSSASALCTKYCRKEHYGVELSEREKTLVRLWIETGATYPGTYAGLGSGMLGGYAENVLDRSDLEWEETKAMQEAMKNRCNSCHTDDTQLPLSVSDEIRHTWWVYPNDPNDSRRKYSRHLHFDLTKPEKSALLLAPLSQEAGGYGLCNFPSFTEGDSLVPVIPDTNDETYKTILAGIERAKTKLDEIKRFDMPDFVPRPQYVREMKKYNILPRDTDPNQVFNTYQLEQDYWKSLWYKPK